MPLCEGCGSSFEDRFGFCPYCGRAKPKQQEIKITIEDDSVLACPFCRQSDRVEKISAIVKHQTQISESSVPVTRTYSGNDGKVRTSTTYEKVVSKTTSSLATSLTPPAKPAIPQKPQATLLFFLALADVFVVFYGAYVFLRGLFLSIFRGWRWNLQISAEFFYLVAVLSIVVFILWMIYTNDSKKYPQVLEEAQRKLSHWEAAMKNWREAYYCYRDERVFIPGSGKSAPVESLVEYIYAE